MGVFLFLFLKGSLYHRLFCTKCSFTSTVIWLHVQFTLRCNLYSYSRSYCNLQAQTRLAFCGKDTQHQHMFNKATQNSLCRYLQAKIILDVYWKLGYRENKHHHHFTRLINASISKYNTMSLSRLSEATSYFHPPHLMRRFRVRWWSISVTVNQSWDDLLHCTTVIQSLSQLWHHHSNTFIRLPFCLTCSCTF